MTEIKLDDNNLTSISFLQNVTSLSVSISNNPFRCDDCEHFQYEWRTFAPHLLHVQNLTCIFEDEQDGWMLRNVSDFKDISKACPSTSLSAEIQALLITVAVLAILLVLFMFLYFRHGWAFRAYLYSKGIYCCTNTGDDDEEDTEKLYDAFVSYSHKVMIALQL